MSNRSNVGRERNRRRFECEDVFECLLDLLEDALGEENENEHENDRCRRVCRECCRCKRNRFEW